MAAEPQKFGPSRLPTLAAAPQELSQFEPPHLFSEEQQKYLERLDEALKMSQGRMTPMQQKAYDEYLKKLMTPTKANPYSAILQECRTLFHNEYQKYLTRRQQRDPTAQALTQEDWMEMFTARVDPRELAMVLPEESSLFPNLDEENRIELVAQLFFNYFAREAVRPGQQIKILYRLFKDRDSSGGNVLGKHRQRPMAPRILFPADVATTRL